MTGRVAGATVQVTATVVEMEEVLAVVMEAVTAREAVRAQVPGE